MDVLNANPSNRSADPIWYLLAEFSISEFLSVHNRRDDLRAGFLYQAVRELGMPAECMENIESTLAEFAAEALVHFKQGRMELPRRIRVFYLKKAIDDGNSTDPTSQTWDAEQAMQPAQIMPSTGTKKMGGWGYFLIERGSGLSSASSSTGAMNSVDLYLYMEGE